MNCFIILVILRSYKYKLIKGIHFSMMELWKGVGGGGVAHQLSEGKLIVDTAQATSKTSLLGGCQECFLHGLCKITKCLAE